VTPPLGRLVVPVAAMPRQQPGSTNLVYPVGRCTYPITSPPPLRLDLLARAHETHRDALIAILAAAAVCVGLGAGFILHGCHPTAQGALHTFLGIGTACLLLGFAATAAVIALPFHGPDEARHAISYARLA